MRDITIVLVGILLLLVFVVFQVDYFIKAEEIELIHKNIYYDSLLLEEQKQLKQKDSIIIHDEKIIKQKLNNHEQRLNKLEIL
jgi:hypothetical protein